VATSQFDSDGFGSDGVKSQWGPKQKRGHEHVTESWQDKIISAALRLAELAAIWWVG